MLAVITLKIMIACIIVCHAHLDFWAGLADECDLGVWCTLTLRKSRHMICSTSQDHRPAAIRQDVVDQRT